MEETIMIGRGLRELHSSELLLRGGGSNFFTNIFEKIRNLIDTIAMQQETIKNLNETIRQLKKQ